MLTFWYPSLQLLQLRFSGPEVLGCGSSHCDESNQLRIFHLQPLLKVPQELGEIFMAAFCFLGQICPAVMPGDRIRGADEKPRLWDVVGENHSLP